VLSKLTRDQAAALAEVTVDDFVDGRGENARAVKRVKFKLHDKRAALVDLGRHIGIFQDSRDSNGAGLQIILNLGEGADEPKPAIELPPGRARSDRRSERGAEHLTTLARTPHKSEAE
jgi:hypothetical protein